MNLENRLLFLIVSPSQILAIGNIQQVISLVEMDISNIPLGNFTGLGFSFDWG